MKTSSDKRNISLLNQTTWILYAGIIFSICALIFGIRSSIFDRLGYSGQFAATFSGMFGMIIASIALKAYVDTENIEKKETDIAWSAKESLLLSFDKFIKIMELHSKIPKINHASAEAIKFISDATTQAIKSPLYKVFHVIEKNKTNNIIGPASLLVLLNLICENELKLYNDGKLEPIDIGQILDIMNNIIPYCVQCDQNFIRNNIRADADHEHILRRVNEILKPFRK